MMSVASLDQLYTHSDVYDALDACAEVETFLGRLRRQHLLTDAEWMESRQDLARITARLQRRLDSQE